MPEHRDDLNPWAVGCYTSQIRIKQKYRRLESELFAAEKICAAAYSQGLMEYPDSEIKEAELDMLKVQFHDILPGSSVQAAEESSIRTMDHGLETLSRVRARAFFALSKGQRPASPDMIPVMIFNPMPYPVETECECEMMLWDQNWDGDFSMPAVHSGEELLPTQCEKEGSNLNLDWRKKVVFRAKLEPLCMNRFDVSFERIPEKPVPDSMAGDYYRFSNGELEVVFDKKNCSVIEMAVNGKKYIEPGAFSLDVYDDDSDPWGMNVVSFPDRIGSFTALDPEVGSLYSGINSRVIPSFRVIEDGAVRTKIECLYGYNDSRAVVTFSLPKKGREIGVSIRVNWNEKQKLLKLSVPTVLRNADFYGETMYGEQKLVPGGRENSSQRYIIIDDGADGLSVSNDGVYGSSCGDGKLCVTLLRSPVYTAHPIKDRERIPQDRFNPHIDQGERTFSFKIFAGSVDSVRRETVRIASLLNDKPVSLSFYPPDFGKKSVTPVSVKGNVSMPVFKKASDGNGFIVRLFNASSETQKFIVDSFMLSAPYDGTMQPWEIKTLRICGGAAYESNPDESGK